MFINVKTPSFDILKTVHVNKCQVFAKQNNSDFFFPYLGIQLMSNTSLLSSVQQMSSGNTKPKVIISPKFSKISKNPPTSYKKNSLNSLFS